MRSRSLAKVAPLIAVALFVALTTLVALAAVTRPNGVDHRVDLLTNAALLTHPATALVDPDRQGAAQRLMRWLLPGRIVSILAQVLALAYFWQGGVAARHRDHLRRRFGSESTVRFLFGAELALVARLAALLPEFYIYRVERTWGLNDQLSRAWSADWIVNTIIAMIATGIVVAVVLWLVDRTHQWYLYTMVAIVGVSIALAYLNPYLASQFDRFRPLPARANAVAASVEQRAHLHVPVVMQVRSRTHLGTAYVQGLGASKRVVVSDTIVAVTLPAELKFVVAHELAYAAMSAPWRIALVDALFVILGAAIAVTIADRIGFRRDDDPVSRLALVGALLGVVYLVVLPIDNLMLQRMSLAADRYAIALTADRAAAVRSIVRATDQRLQEACPDVMTRMFMEPVADPSSRIAAINGVRSACP